MITRPRIEMEVTPGELAAIERRLAELAASEVYVGLRQDKRHQSGDDYLSIATTNEFGDPARRIPERSFMRSTLAEQSYREPASIVARAVVNGEAVRTALGREIGQRVVRDIQRKIVDLKTPPNSPVTIKLKGSSNPLIDTGRLGQSIDYEIRGGGS